MQRYEIISQKIQQLYDQKLSSRDTWADWLYANHIFVAAEYAKTLANAYGARAELPMAGAALHDIGDAKTSRFDPEHLAITLAITREFATDAGFDPDDVELLVNAVQYHSCHDDEKPYSKEGLIVATADALTHLKTDFYLHAIWANADKMSLIELKEWTLKKIDRDMYKKIHFEPERIAAQADYDALKRLFSC